MHECPSCGQMCDCDGEDLFSSLTPEDCECPCLLLEDEEEVDEGETMTRYKLNNNGLTVLDMRTGLKWQQGGSISIYFQEAQVYIYQLNYGSFAGYDDWRLPTRDELCTLLSDTMQETSIYIDPIFDPTQERCWASTQSLPEEAWLVYFNHGNIDHNQLNRKGYVRAVRSQTKRKPCHDIK